MVKRKNKGKSVDKKKIKDRKEWKNKTRKEDKENVKILKRSM